MTIAELEQNREELVKQAKKLLSAAGDENRLLDQTEYQRLTALFNKLDIVEGRIESLKQKETLKRMTEEEANDPSKKINRKINRKHAQEEYSISKAPFDDPMSLEETADYLSVSENTIKRYIKERGLPAMKIHKHFIFSRNAVMHWLNSWACNA